MPLFFSFSPQVESDLINLVPSRKYHSLLLLSLITTLSFAGWQPTWQILTSSRTAPEAFLVLGGHEERERFAAKLARQHPQLPIWISSGSPQNYARQIFAQAGIKSDRLNFDYRASDTVTNFTTIVDQLQAQGINNVYLITSSNHMQRAKIIGDIVLRSRGIDFQPISVPSDNPPEPIEKCWRDGARSILWLFTGRTGAILVKYG
ncbi:MAG: YdcF family protein [Cyanobacteria bacterium J06621_8]